MNNGLGVDGPGVPRGRAEVASRGGKIVVMGKVTASTTQSIDART